MEEVMEHTPIPWYTELVTKTDTGLQATIICARNDSRWPSGGRTIAEVGHWRDRIDPEADAQFIVRAVNNHDKLLAALEGLVGAFRDNPNKPSDSKDWAYTISTDIFAEGIPRARDAIEEAQK